MTSAHNALVCDQCHLKIDPTGPVIAEAGANGFTGQAFIPFADQAPTLGTGGLLHIACFLTSNGADALTELLHAPKARAMGQS